MKERPILMAGDLVKATLEGRKKMARRPVKGAVGAFWDHPGYRPFVAQGAVAWEMADGSPVPPALPVPRTVCPFGPPGDRLWVRETWGECMTYGGGGRAIAYRATGTAYPVWSGPRVIYDSGHEHAVSSGQRWRPSIHMPRWASRLTLEAVSVRVERVQDITEADAIAEGFVATAPEFEGLPGHSAREAFLDAWSAIYTAPPCSVACNPWVWAITYRVFPDRKAGER